MRQSGLDGASVRLAECRKCAITGVTECQYWITYTTRAHATSLQARSGANAIVRSHIDHTGRQRAGDN